MKRIESFEHAQAYLLETISETISPRTSYKLDRMRALLSALGDPHLTYPTIHVGGTSGKGSTCTMIVAALQTAGRCTGLHTKPHLYSVTERAQVDGVDISTDRLTELLDSMMPAIENVMAAGFGRPTYYETLLALAFVHFARESVDVAVIEVGLGGRLDGTNVIVPEVAAITSVGLDHTDVLGDSLVAIAREKAGIAKRGVPLVIGEIEGAALATIEACAAEAGARPVRVCDHARIENAAVDAGSQRFEVVTAAARYRLVTAVLGEFQRSNAATALVVLEQLNSSLRPDVAAVESAFSQMAIPGRMEIAPGHPVVVFDIAHNPEKAEHLVSSLRETFGGRRFHFVIAIGESKDAQRILATFAMLPSTFTFTSFDVPSRRAIPPHRLSLIAETIGAWGRTIADPAEALDVARRNAGAQDVVVVTGSTFVVAALREWPAVAAIS
jgi:dihydrofolate synthase/folylpolyglutamate synthase